MGTEHVSTVVVGAGPYGLSVAAHLRARGIPHRIFGWPMSMWSDRMPRGMFLKSEGMASSLSDPGGKHTLRAFCQQHGLPYGDIGWPVPIDTFLAYGQWFQRERVPHVEQLDVVGLERTGDGFRVRLSDGSDLAAGRVVVATGLAAFAYVPPELEGLPPELASHPSAHRDLDAFAGQDVAIVGAGQSALESAALLLELGARPRVLVRKRHLDWNHSPDFSTTGLERLLHPVSGLGFGWKLKAYEELPDAFRRLPPAWRISIVRTVLGPAGAWWLRERVLGRVPLELDVRLRGGEAVGGRVRLELERDGRREHVEADHVMAATGYRVDLSRLPFLDRALLTALRTYRGYPLLTRDFESSVPGLYFVGNAAAFSFGPVQRFVVGSSLAAGRVSAALARPAVRRGRFALPRRGAVATPSVARAAGG